MPVAANVTYKIWNGFLAQMPFTGLIEAYLFTDAVVYGQVEGLGPYSFFNTLAHAGYYDPTSARPAIAVRVEFRGDDEPPSADLSDSFDHYHGGDFLDEIAALASLFLGRRVMAGSVEREFEPGGDPYGRTRQWNSKVRPVLPPTAMRPVIASLTEGVNLGGLEALSDFAARPVLDTNALVKAARLYQQAVWLSNSTPELSWLMLVAVVEAVADRWAATSRNVTEGLAHSMPKLFDLLTENCPELVDQVAQTMSQYTGATKKFVDFIVKFVPPAPAERPDDYLCFSYDQANLRKAVATLYGHRSNALHGGVAFPEPMCSPPMRDSRNRLSEKPYGLAIGARGARWNNKQTPLHLHTFEHIARGAILNWWSCQSAK